MAGVELTQENSALMYLQSCIDFIQDFPNEMACYISETRAISVKKSKYSSMAVSLKDKYLLMQEKWNDEEKERCLIEFEDLILALERESDLQLDIIRKIQDELIARKRQLDASYRLTMNSKINEYNGLMNNKKKNENSSNGRNSPAFSKDKDNGSCNGKRIRRGSNKNDNNESNYGSGDDHSSTNATNDRSNSVKKKRGLKNSSKRSKYDSYDPSEETYCLCAQVSYGDMIACDNKDCAIQWFHFCCVNLSTKPKGRWFCPNCRGERSNIQRK